MRVQKLYLHRKYNQWKGKELYVEDEIDGKYGVYVCIPDAHMVRGSINSIFADFKDKNKATYSVGCIIVDYERNLFKFFLPSDILSNDGIYEVVFSISYNSSKIDSDYETLVGSDFSSIADTILIGHDFTTIADISLVGHDFVESNTTTTLVKTAIQTFTVVDTIEIDDESIKQDTHYPILVQLIDEIAQYKVDTSSFPTFEDVEKLIEKSKEEESVIQISSIVSELDKLGYAKKDYIHANYVSKFDSAQFVKASDLYSYVKTTTFTSTLSNYALSSSLKNYVVKEVGKGLSTHDLTDELYNKLINLSSNGGGGNDGGGTTGGGVIDSSIYNRLDKLEEIIKDKASTLYVDNLYNKIVSELKNYYTKDESDNRFALKSDIMSPSDYYTRNDVDNKFALKSDISNPTNLTVNDILYNKNGFNTLGDYLEELNYVAPKINSFIMTPSKTIYEKGVDSISNLIFSWNINKQITSLSLTGFSSLSPTQTNAVYTSLISDTKTFTLSVSDGKNTAQSSKTINFVYPFYYGTTDLESINNSTILNGSKLIEMKGQKSLMFSYSNAKVFFAYPSTYGVLKDIKDGNGFSYNSSYTRSQVTINNISYYVYLSNVKASADSILYNFIF